MKKKQDNISVIHLSQYNLPTISETTNKEWVQFGDNNLYPQYLLELYNGSSINNAVIKGVSAMIYGEGINATDRDESDIKKEYVSSTVKLTTMFVPSILVKDAIAKVFESA